jgi:hypothetical protein
MKINKFLIIHIYNPEFKMWEKRKFKASAVRKLPKIIDEKVKHELKRNKYNLIRVFKFIT